MRSCLLSFALTVAAVASLSGQACPKPSESGPSVPSELRSLEGQLVFHDDIRGWFELKMDQQQCGQSSIQLTSSVSGGKPLQVLRGCRVRSRGVIDLSPTGSYTLDMYQDVQAVEAVGTCERQLPFPDYSKAKPDKAVRSYRVEMHVDFEPGDHPVEFRVTNAGKELHPWQAYASYYLTAGFVLYGHCSDGFFVDKVFGTPEAHPGHFDEPGTSDDMAMFDTGSLGGAGKNDLHLGYTCVHNH